jgi:hypothetical protein
LQALDRTVFASIESIVLYFLLLWVVPALGSAIGAKIGGRYADFHYIGEDRLFHCNSHDGSGGCA